MYYDDTITINNTFFMKLETYIILSRRSKIGENVLRLCHIKLTFLKWFICFILDL
jgi:hypothetical protein